MSEATQMKQSRNGKKPVVIPDSVQVSIDGTTVKVKGPKGEIERTFREFVTISKDGSDLTVTPVENAGKKGPQFQGLTRALLASMVEGAKEGYTRSLDFRGVGSSAAVPMRELPLFSFAPGLGKRMKDSRRCILFCDPRCG